MSIDSILVLIDAEIASLTQARSLLGSAGKVETKVAEPETKKTAKAAKTHRKKRRAMSPEARKRIADAQRKRWASLKSKAK
ncbi:MAG: hypothetical protein ABSD72_01065 [Terracidiphilus sp.]|jgi:hypothetical protein